MSDTAPASDVEPEPTATEPVTDARSPSEEAATEAGTEAGAAAREPEADKKPTGSSAAADGSFGGDAALVDEPDPWD